MRWLRAAFFAEATKAKTDSEVRAPGLFQPTTLNFMMRAVIRVPFMPGILLPYRDAGLDDLWIQCEQFLAPHGF